MSGGSIRLRLFVAAAISVVAALSIAGLGQTFLFERHVERRINTELTTHLNQLIAGVAIAEDGVVSVARPPTDPRFQVPLSGLYWQVIDESTRRTIRSRSLWDASLDAPPVSASAGTQSLEIRGHDGGLLIALQREIREATHADRPLRVIVAIDHREVEVASREFGQDLLPSLAILSAVLILAAWVQVAVGLRPLERLRRAVGDVMANRKSRLDTDVPREVQPLADEINRLLEAQADALVKARSSAADLAHGLKTPLQVLAADIRALRDRGQADLAENIAEVAGTIRRHVDRELTRRRTAPAPGSTSAFADVAGRVVNVVRRTPRGETIEFIIDAVPGQAVAMDETDLSEVLGNLVENASRFGRSRIVIAARETATTTNIEVADDGPGIPEDAKSAVLARGARLDLRGDGAGLGLAIVADVVEVYGGKLSLEDAGPGLRAVIHIPRPAKS